MTDEYRPRMFADDAAIVHLGEGLIHCTLERAEWTHEAHLAASLWLIVARPEFVAERDLPGLIRRFNESVGGVNDATQGYHETITQAFLRGIRSHLARTDPGRPLVDKVNRLLEAPEGRRGWPLRFYSRERLFSVEARLRLIAPDLAPFDPSQTADQPPR
jgi:hypothetical protein